MTQCVFETLRYVVEEGIATIHLHRPERLNAITEQMVDELIDVFDLTDADDAVRCLIITGSGRAFCAGADLSGGRDTFVVSQNGNAPLNNKVGDVHRDGGGRLALRIYESLKPVIAAVNGPAVGLGVTMQLPMDFRLASTEARFGFVFARRGITPEACSSWFLPRLVGAQQALEWIFTGRVFGAHEALQGGLVRSVHAADDLLPAARTLAKEISDNAAPVSIALSRQLIWRMLGSSHPMDAHRADSRAVQFRGSSADALEGVAAFLEKRPAIWSDKVSDGLPDAFPDLPKQKFE